MSDWLDKLAAASAGGSSQLLTGPTLTVFLQDWEPSPPVSVAAGEEAHKGELYLFCTFQDYHKWQITYLKVIMSNYSIHT